MGLIILQIFIDYYSIFLPFSCIVIATIYCMPSFVIDLVFLILRPDIESCDMEYVYYFLASTWDFMKSLSIGLFYCYTEKRVSFSVFTFHVSYFTGNIALFFIFTIQFISAFKEQWRWMKIKIGCSKNHTEAVNPEWKDYGLKM